MCGCMCVAVLVLLAREQAWESSWRTYPLNRVQRTIQGKRCACNGSFKSSAKDHSRQALCLQRLLYKG